MVEPAARVRFRCSIGQEFDLFALDEWVAERRAAGELPAYGFLEVEVVHPDREGDGNCRWCGCPRDEVVVVGGGP